MFSRLLSLRSLMAIGLLWCVVAVPAVSQGADVQWIWSAAATPKDQAAGDCHFRKTFRLEAPPESGEVSITADDSYELWVNGQLVAEGANWRQLDRHSIRKFLVQGQNVLAIKASKSEPGPAGVAVRVFIKARNKPLEIVSDSSWRTSIKERDGWELPRTSDNDWLAAKALGKLGTTAPWFDEVQGLSAHGRFKLPREFAIDTYATHAQTGSINCMAFAENGDLFIATERGGLVRLIDSNGDGAIDATQNATTKLTAIQGILPLNGQVLATGKGPGGVGLYKLSNRQTSGEYADLKLIVPMRGDMHEHGPHAPVLGPDGFVYVVIGNHSGAKTKPEPSSPYIHTYEGELNVPRFEDPLGHAVGIKAPGGTVIRTDTEGSFVETFVGGLRNCYDISFTRGGDLITADSDMEWDEGTAWYRPTRLMHLTAGGEFGWRSGWAKWPEYYLDSLPAMANTGRGSPTGVAVYDHFMFPRRYNGVVFVGDWTRGRILAVKLIPHNGSFRTETETFVEGQPLNVTDVAVGPDGALYCCTGGRGAEGGVFRIRWKGKVPDTVRNLGNGIQRAVRQPQLDSAFARAALVSLKRTLGETWNTELPALATRGSAPAAQRCQALDLMQLLGPLPSVELLSTLATDRDVTVRVKAAYLLGLHATTHELPILAKLSTDADPTVARTALESLARSGMQIDCSGVIKLLGSPHRHVAFAARKLLERQPTNQWRDAVLRAKDARIFLYGSTALLTVAPTEENCLTVLDIISGMLDGYVNDRDFLDLLRVTQLAMIRGEIPPEKVGTIAHKLVEEYPTRNRLMNRELVRLIAFTDNGAACERMLEQLRGKASSEEKVHIAMHSRFVRGWTGPQKLEMLRYCDRARDDNKGMSYGGYLDAAMRQLATTLDEAERTQLLAEGEKWPNAAFALISTLPASMSRQTETQLERLDEQLLRETKGAPSPAAKRLGIAIVAALGKHASEDSTNYLRQLYARDPSRRAYIAAALAQHPEGPNWNLLVSALPTLDGALAEEVLRQLAKSDRRPREPEAFRQLILLGLKHPSTAPSASKLLTKWTKAKVAGDGRSIEPWQTWFNEKFPQHLRAELPRDNGHNKWTADELLAYLEQQKPQEVPDTLGAGLFAEAQCASCHRFGDHGEAIGPDLTTVSRRFQRREILEAILYPSHVISDQYIAQQIVTVDGKVLVGMVSPQGDDAVNVVLNDGSRTTLAREEIDVMKPSHVSLMPEGLLNTLSLEQINALLQYLERVPETAVTSRRDQGAL